MAEKKNPIKLPQKKWGPKEDTELKNYWKKENRVHREQNASCYKNY